ncbi:MAG: Rieske 2Fe-2S domain-containing protein [Pirellulaceae bacterium]
MAKKMSVEEVLAAARAAKAGQSASAAPAEVPANEPAPQEPAAAAAAPASDSRSVAPVAKAVPAGGKGMSMADILAAARAGKGAAAPAVAEKPAKPAVAEKAAQPAVAEKAASKPAAAKPGGESNGGSAAPKDTASILAAARTGAKPGPMSKSQAAALATPAAPAGKKKIEVPPMPAKPDYARSRAATAEAGSRRSFLGAVAGMVFGSSMAIGFSALAATHLMWLLGTARFMFPNILIEPPTKFKVGFPDGLAPGQVETKFIAQFGVWIVRHEFEGAPIIYALKSVCTHLGCTPNWLEAEQKFKCPCHGSGFYKDGVNFEGPAPRPLERYAVSVADDGQLLVDKSRTFQEEMGQWKDTASYVSV